MTRESSWITRRPGRPRSRSTPSNTSTMGSSGETSAGGTSQGYHSTRGGCWRSHGSAAAREIQSSNSRATLEPRPRSSACSGRYSMWQSRRQWASDQRGVGLLDGYGGAARGETLAKKRCSASSSRGGVPGANVTVSNPIRARSNSTRSSSRRVTCSQPRRSSSEVGTTEVLWDRLGRRADPEVLCPQPAISPKTVPLTRRPPASSSALSSPAHAQYRFVDSRTQHEHGNVQP